MNETQIDDIRAYLAEQVIAHQSESEQLGIFAIEHATSLWHRIVHKNRLCRRLEDLETRRADFSAKAERATTALSKLDQGEYHPAAEIIAERIRVLSGLIQKHESSSIGIGLGNAAVEGAYLDSLTLMAQSQRATREIKVLNNFRRVLDRTNTE